MFFRRQTEIAAPKNEQYAQTADFCRFYQERLARLYSLALLLTGDQLRAEECLSRSLETCLASNGVFKGWEERWAVHTIIKEAIRMPGLGSAGESAELRLDGSRLELLAGALGQLTTLDRFAYVMTVLEQYSDRESASFLGCSAVEVRTARERAIKKLAETDLLARMEERVPLRMIS